MQIKNNTIGSSVVIIAFLIAYYNQDIFNALGLDVITAAGASSSFFELFIRVAAYLLPAIVAFIVVLDIKQSVVFDGFFKKLASGIFLGILFTLPMWLYAQLNYSARSMNLIFFDKIFIAAIIEEILFRGFLFGLLFYRFGWNFFSAALYSSVMFGIGHTYQTANTNEMLLIAALTSAIAFWWCWLYVEWGGNLYLVVALHALMNFVWFVFLPIQNVLGMTESNSLRLATVLLSVLITLYLIKMRGYSLLWNRKGA